MVILRSCLKDDSITILITLYACARDKVIDLHIVCLLLSAQKLPLWKIQASEQLVSQLICRNWHKKLASVCFELFGTAHGHCEQGLLVIVIVTTPIDHAHYRPYAFCSCTQLAR